MFDEKIRGRAETINIWLRENYPDLNSEQAHLDVGTPARGYWHAGYRSALVDVLNLMKKETFASFSVNNPGPGTDN